MALAFQQPYDVKSVNIHLIDMKIGVPSDK